MSSTGQWVGAIAGGVIGFFVGGGPMGAVQGAYIGMSFGGYVDPPPGPNLKGPTLDDKSFQSSAYGVSLPRLYGTVAVLGNIIYLENNEYKAVSKKEKQGGKGGGGGGTYESTTYFATFAVALGEAKPGSSIRRMWAGGKLIASAPGVGVGIFSQESSGVNYRYYDGSQTDPDTRMEAVLGVGNCPSYCGTAYVVFYDFELTAYGNGLTGCPIKVELYDGGSGGGGDFEDYEIVSVKDFKVPQTFTSHGCPTVLTADGSTIVNADSGAGNAYYYVAIAGVGGADISETGTYINTPIHSKLGTLRFANRFNFIDDGGNRHSGVYTNIDKIDNPFVGYPESYSQPFAEINALIDDGAFVYAFSVTSDNTPAGVPDATMILTRAGYAEILIDFDVLDVGFVAIFDGFLYRLTKIYAGTAYLKKYSLSGGGEISSIAVVLPFTPDYLGYVSFGEIYGSEFYFYNVGSTLKIGTVHIVTGAVDFAAFEIGLAGFSSSQRSCNVSVVDGVIGVSTGFYFAASNRGIRVCILSNQASNSDYDIAAEQPLVNIVEAECALAGVTSGMLNLDEIVDDKIIGYKISDISSVRSGLSPLEAYKLYDMVELGYLIHAKKRDRTAVFSVAHSELVLSNNTAMKSAAESGMLMPSRMVLNYIDYTREYDAGSQYADYPSAFNSQSVKELSIVMTPDDAAKAADIFIRTAHVENKKYEFTLPQKFLGVASGDILNVEIYSGRYVGIRVLRVDIGVDQTIKISGALTSSLTYSSGSVGVGGIAPPNNIIPAYSKPTPLILDIPMIESDQDIFGVVATVYQAEPFTKSILYVSPNSGVSYTELGLVQGPGTVGQCLFEKLSASDGLVFEPLAELYVQNVLCGEFYSVTFDEMMAGKNYVAYGRTGRWEIMCFTTATPSVDGGVVLSGLLRGMFGTEQYTGTHGDVDFVVLLDDVDNIFAPLPAQAVGQQWPFRSVNLSSDFDLGTDAAPVTYEAVNLKPLSPVKAVLTKPAADWLINATPRTRYQSTRWTSGANEQTDTTGYEVDIYKAGAVVRTIASATLPITYFSAQQVADFGAAQTSLTVKIYQINSRVGRGYPLESTI
jgi:hypothetical protein